MTLTHRSDRDFSRLQCREFSWNCSLLTQDHSMCGNNTKGFRRICRSFSRECFRTSRKMFICGWYSLTKWLFFHDNADLFFCAESKKNAFSACGNCSENIRFECFGGSSARKVVENRRYQRQKAILRGLFPAANGAKKSGAGKKYPPHKKNNLPFIGI